MKKSKRMLIPFATVATLSMLLTACGGTKTSGSSGGGDNSPLQVSIMSVSLLPTPPAPDNAIQKEIEKATNSKLNIQWVSGNNYTDKLNVTLASGAIPDLIYINDPFSPVFRQMVAQGAFWDVGPYSKDYPNLSNKISKTAWDLTKQQDGKDYGIPRPRPAEADSFVIVRKDWLDRYGLKVPTTTDELYQDLKTFKENEADQSGKNDTVPFTGNINTQDLGSFGQIENSFTGANGIWKLVNGKLTFTALLPEERGAIEYLKKLYDQKLIPEDFASIKQTQMKDLFKAGRAGAIVDKAGTMTDYMDPLKKIDSKVQYTDFYPVTNLNGYNPKGPGFSGILAIPKTVPEDKMKRILKLVDTWMNDNVFQFQQYGIEGVDYTVKDGQKVINQDKLNQDGGPDYNQIVYVADPYASSTKVYFPKDVNDLYQKIQDDRAKTSVADISVGLYSPTAQQYLPDIQKNMTDLKVKIILGQSPLTAWDDYVNKLKADPNMTKMTQEINDAYQERRSAK